MSTERETTKRPEGRSISATWKRDVSPFPHRRNLSVLPGRISGALGFALCTGDHLVNLVSEEEGSGDRAVVVQRAAEVEAVEVGDTRIAIGAGHEPAAAVGGIARVIDGAAGVKLDRCGSHLKPPCSRNGDKSIFLLSALNVKPAALPAVLREPEQ